jgi:hypothetical protein
VKIFIAIVSSGSIASWAIWQSLAALWATIIAASQLVNAVKPYLPYERRLKQLPPLAIALDNLFLDAERRWFAVAEGQLTDAQIHDALIDLKQRRNDADHAAFKDSPLPIQPKLLLDAETRAKAYFEQAYPTEA